MVQGNILKEDVGLTGMRGIAALMVLFFHIVFSAPKLSLGQFVFFGSLAKVFYQTYNVSIKILSSGNYGVVFFFLISGYILVRKIENKDYNYRGRFSKTVYFMRRVFRTWPLYFIAVFVFAFVGMTPLIWQSFLFIQNFSPSTFTYNPTWTLMVEELFYLILPVWIFIFRKNWKASLAATAVISLGYLAFVRFIFGAYLTLPAQTPLYFFYAQFPTFAFTFALGTIIAYKKRIRLHWIPIFLMWLILSYENVVNYSTLIEYAFLPVILFSIVYYLALSSLDRSRIFTNRISVFIGRRAYPFYLFGFPIQLALISALGQYNPLWIIGTIALTAICSHIVHELIEGRFISLGKSLEKHLIWKNRL